MSAAQTARKVFRPSSAAICASGSDSRRWLTLAVICSAAAAQGHPRPQPWRRLPHQLYQRCRHIRHLPVPHLLHAGEPGLSTGDVGRGDAPHGGAHRRRGQRGQHQADAASAPSPWSRPGCWATRPGCSGTFGVAPSDAGIASASANTGQELGGAIGTALSNTIAASAAAGCLASNLHGRPTRHLVELAAVHSYTSVFWFCAGIFAAGAIICGALLRRGPLTRPEAIGVREAFPQVAETQPESIPVGEPTPEVVGARS